MSNFHKPIPTTYNGTTYRSRLEARWALFFEKMNIWASYEPFVIENNGLSWTPDFYAMSGISCWPESIGALIEIKPIVPNAKYVEYLMKIRDPKKSDFLILIGNPSAEIRGVHIYGSNDSYCSAFVLSRCTECQHYFPAHTSGGCISNFHCDLLIPKDIDDVLDEVLNYRFDLEN